MSVKKFIILDRDGVINIDSKDYIKSPEEWTPLPGSLEAIALLYQAGYRVVVATNQSGIAHGLYNEAILDQIHQKMHAALALHGAQIEGVFYCPHRAENHCQCRKPLPGLLEQIATTYAISLQNVPFVGDSLRDIEAAKAGGALPILVLSGNGKKTLEKHREKVKNIEYHENLLAFARKHI